MHKMKLILKSVFEENASQTIIKHLEMIPPFVFFPPFFMTLKRKYFVSENNSGLILKATVYFGT